MQEHNTHEPRAIEPRWMEIWFAKLGRKENSSVQGGGRPVLVLSNDISNTVSSVVTVLPMTSKPKRLDLPSHTWVEAEQFDGLRTGALILAEQITTIDRSWLVFRIGVCKDDKTVRQIEQSVKDQLGMNEKEAANMYANIKSPGKTKQDYLNSLPEWDGEKRIDTMLIDYLGARDSAYVREVGRNLMLSAVDRAFSENPVTANTPMLIGPPKCGKSVFIGKLGSSYSETVAGNLGSKTPRMLAGNLLVEVCESGSAVMEMIHRPEPFQAVITMNEIPEIGGGRRLSPVHVGIHDTGRAFTVEQDEIDQLWAEAVAAYKNGEKPYAGVRDADGRALEAQPIPKKHPYGID